MRGFNRFEVPLLIDGIRVFLPADNRLDYGRFLTSDIAEIQVAKGYVSVLDGPDGMGGAINLVTRKPTKAVEAEASATVDLGRRRIRRLQRLRAARDQAGQMVRAGPLRPQCPGPLGPVRRLSPDGERERRPPRPSPHRATGGSSQDRLHPQRHRRIFDQLHRAGGRQAGAAAHHRTRCDAAVLDLAGWNIRQPLFPVDDGAGRPARP